MGNRTEAAPTNPYLSLTKPPTQHAQGKENHTQSTQSTLGANAPRVTESMTTKSARALPSNASVRSSNAAAVACSLPAWRRKHTTVPHTWAGCRTAPSPSLKGRYKALFFLHASERTRSGARAPAHSRTRRDGSREARKPARGSFSIALACNPNGREIVDVRAGCAVSPVRKRASERAAVFGAANLCRGQSKQSEEEEGKVLAHKSRPSHVHPKTHGKTKQVKKLYSREEFVFLKKTNIRPGGLQSHSCKA